MFYAYTRLVSAYIDYTQYVVYCVEFLLGFWNVHAFRGSAPVVEIVSLFRVHGCECDFVVHVFFWVHVLHMLSFLLSPL